MTEILRVLTLLGLMSVTAGEEPAASDLDVFTTPETRREAGQLFIQYQKASILASLAQRDAEVDALQSRQDVLARARAAREAFLGSIGGLPSEKSPLAARTAGVVDRGGFTIEKVLYQSRPGFWVAAHLYLPKRLDGKTVPAVLTPMGHSSEGKCARWLQERAIGLARLGYVVLAYDQVGLGERWQYWDPETGLSRIGHRKPTGEPDSNRMRTTLEHFHAGNQAWLTGDSLARYVVWDAVRGVDYLLTRPEVDPDRIACSGASMGGLATMVLTAVEPRLKVSVPVSHVSKRRFLVEKAMARDAEQIFLGCYSEGWDHGDLLLPIVLERGYLQLCANTEDYFPIEGARITARELARLFRVVGLGEHFRIAEAEHGHGWNKGVYENLYAFLSDTLDHPPAAPEHTVTKADTVSPHELWCTESGQVTAPPLESRTVFDIGRAKAVALRDRRLAKQSPEEVIAAARRRVAVDSMPGHVPGRRVGTFSTEDSVIEKWLIDTEPGLRLPALLIRRGGVSATPTRVVIHASPRGKQNVFQNPSFPLERLLDEGALVLAVDVRGWGETRWHREPGKPSSTWREYTSPIYGEESILTYNALRNGQTMVGQWAYDLLASAFWVRGRTVLDGDPGPRITLWGEGRLGIAALHALALSRNGPTDAVVQDTLYAYDDWANTRYYHVPVSLVVPGILEDYDLSELTWAVSAARGKCVVTWINPVDAKGNPVERTTVTRLLDEVGANRDGRRAQNIARVLVAEG